MTASLIFTKAADLPANPSIRAMREAIAAFEQRFVSDDDSVHATKANIDALKTLARDLGTQLQILVDDTARVAPIYWTSLGRKRPQIGMIADLLVESVEEELTEVSHWIDIETGEFAE